MLDLVLANPIPAALAIVAGGFVLIEQMLRRAATPVRARATPAAQRMTGRWEKR